MAVTTTIQYTLRPKDLKKASELFGIELATLERLNSQRLLDATYIRNILIRADYERLTSGLHWLEHQDKNYNFPEVQRAIRREYNISPKVLRNILCGRKSETLRFCIKCGVRISKATYERTGGLCSNCYADSLEL